MDCRYSFGHIGDSHFEASIVASRIGILGGGESGISAALLALSNQDVPFVSEYNRLSDNDRESLISHQIEFEENGHSIDVLYSCDLIIKSPGIPQTAPIIYDLRKREKRIVSEIEYAFTKRPPGSKLIGITGSNGKTTTTNLIYHLLSQAGLSCAKGGNLGPAFSFLLLQPSVDYYIVEVSSFQLEDISEFRPDIALLLNISPDHLDRYDNDFDLYAQTKLKIAENQFPNDVFVYNGDDYNVSSRVQQANILSELVQISNALNIVKFENPYLLGDHNRMNALFACAVARRLGLNNNIISDGLSTFVNDDHRMQPVATINGVKWINDSKATNVDATKYALQSAGNSIIWIAGGVDKGNDYSDLRSLVEENVKCIIALGVDNHKIIDSFDGLKEVYSVDEMSKAVARAKELSEEGDTVLLSPACASFDLFMNYKDRGMQFMTELNVIVREQISKYN